MQALHFSCLTCRANLTMPPSASGQAVLCPKCKATMIVPSAAVAIRPGRPASEVQLPDDGAAVDAVPVATDIALSGERTRCHQCGKVIAVEDAERREVKVGGSSSFSLGGGSVYGGSGNIMSGGGWSGSRGSHYARVDLCWKCDKNMDDREHDNFVFGLIVFGLAAVGAVIAFLLLR